jgi:hypothetical protein
MLWRTTVADHEKTRHHRHQHGDHYYKDALPATASSRASFSNEEFRRIGYYAHFGLAS